MKFCPYCGKPIHELANFCQACGGDLRKMASPESAGSTEYKFGEDASGKYADDKYSADAASPAEDPAETDDYAEYAEEQPEQREYYRRRKEEEEEEHYSREKQKTVVAGVVLAALICVGGIVLWFAVSNMLDRAPAIDVGSGLNNKVVQVTAAPDKEKKSEEGSDGSEADRENDKESDEPAVGEETQQEEETVVTAAVAADAPQIPDYYQKAGFSGSDASSELREEDGTVHTSDLMLDGVDSTSWQEADAGEGVGEWITATLDRRYSVRYVTFKMGNWRSKDHFERNNRPARILLRLDEREFYLDFPDSMTEFTVELSEDCQASSVLVQILDVYEGTRWSDCCIAEMAVYGY